MNKSKIDYVFDYLNNNDFRYHMVDGTPYKELSMEERDILSTYTIELQQKNKQLQERIEYLERSNNRREVTILEQRQEISDLEDNWNKLKEIAKSRSGLKKQCYNGGLWFEIDELLDKMQEIEGSDCNE